MKDVISGRSMVQDSSLNPAALLGSARHDLFLQLIWDRVTVDGVERLSNGRCILFKKDLPIDALINENATNYKPGDVILYEEPYSRDAGSCDGHEVAATFTSLDERSAFDSHWGVGHGSIVRFENDHFLFAGNAQTCARDRYGLTPLQRFLGRIGTNIFYWEQTQPNRLCFFDLAAPDVRFSVRVPPFGFLPRWRIESLYLVLRGSSDKEIWAQVRSKQSIWTLGLLTLDFVRVDLSHAMRL